MATKKKKRTAAPRRAGARKAPSAKKSVGTRARRRAAPVAAAAADIAGPVVVRGPVALVPVGPAAALAVSAATRGVRPVTAVAARIAEAAGIPGVPGAVPARALSVSDQRARARTQRVVIVEGDSWYNFPVPFAAGLDFAMRNRHRYDIGLHFARAGATLRGMVFGTRRRDLSDVLEALEAVHPRVMLFSGGGNDVVGPEFRMYLNHRDSGRTALRTEFADLQFADEFLPTYRHLIRRVHEASPNTKIFVHGYAHAFPSGRAVDIAFLDDLGIIRIGPWIRPSLEDNGWDQRTGREVVINLIDRFNGMLATLQSEFAGTFFHVDLRPAVTRAADWRDELHLTNRAWERCADVMHRVIAANVPNW